MSTSMTVPELAALPAENKVSNDIPPKGEEEACAEIFQVQESHEYPTIEEV